MASTRAQCSRAISEKQRAHHLHLEIEQAMQHRRAVAPQDAPAAKQSDPPRFAPFVLSDFLAETDNPYEQAKGLIDGYGLQARYVALENAIRRVLAGDMAGERIWRGVFEAVIELQKRRKPVPRPL
jgi:hypothetical protein